MIYKIIRYSVPEKANPPRVANPGHGGNENGDEGKGKITDLLAEKSDVVIRFQGGANAGHTIICDYGRFALHQLPSGVFYPHTTNIIGTGVALDIPKFLSEL